MSDQARQRRMRAYQAKSRGDRVSHKTEAENALLLFAWEAGDLSEGQMARALDIDRVTLRKMRDDARTKALALAEQLLPLTPRTAPSGATGEQA